jgi:hypothetical protein
LVYAEYLAKENLMVPLMLGVMWYALRLVREPSSKIAIGCGLLLGILALTGNAALSLAGAVTLAMVLAPASIRGKVTLAAIMVTSALVVAAPWMARNMQLIGAPILNTNGGFNLYLGNNPAATGWFVSIADTPRGPSWEELRKEGEVRASETLKREAIAWIKGHPGEFLELAFKKAVYFWTPPFHQGKGQVSTAEATVRTMWAIEFLLLISASLGSVFVRRLRNRQLAILWVAIGSYTAVHMLFYVIFRYREPIMPVLCVIAALTVEALLRKRSTYAFNRR